MFRKCERASEDKTIYKLAAALQSLLKRLPTRLGVRDRYRPERHYMRGPGPKARAVAGQQRH